MVSRAQVQEVVDMAKASSNNAPKKQQAYYMLGWLDNMDGTNKEPSNYAEVIRRLKNYGVKLIN